MSSLDKLALQQLHINDVEQLKLLTNLLELLTAKGIQAVLPDLLKVKHDDAVTVEGEVKAVVSDGTVEVTNLSDLEQYFIGLQLAVVEAIATPVTVKDDYADIVPHPDLNATGALNFGAANIAMVVVRFVGGDGRVAQEGGTASVSNGAYCPDGEPAYIPVTNGNLHLYLPASTTAYVYGLARA